MNNKNQSKMENKNNPEKKSKLVLIVNVAVLVAGLCLVFFHGNVNVMKVIVVLLGVCIIIPSLVYMGMVLTKRSEENDTVRNIGIVPAAGGLCFGIVLMLKNEMFLKTLGIIFGLLIIALGVFHTVYMIMMSKRARVEMWYYIFPVLMMIGGLLILVAFRAPEHATMVVLITGLSMILFSFTTLLEYLADRKAVKTAASMAAVANAAKKSPKVIDVESAVVPPTE